MTTALIFSKPIRKPAHPNSKNMRRLKRTIFRRDNFTCQATGCGKVFTVPVDWNGESVKGLTLGHIVPHGWGGGWTVNNLKAECSKCNNERGCTLWV